MGSRLDGQPASSGRRCRRLGAYICIAWSEEEKEYQAFCLQDEDATGRGKTRQQAFDSCCSAIENNRGIKQHQIPLQDLESFFADEG